MRHPVSVLPFVLLVAIGCRGEFDSCERGQEGCPCNDGTCLDGLTCVSDVCEAPDEADLLENASFEDWTGDDPLFWERDADAWTETNEAPAHGDSAARVTAASYSGISQTVSSNEPFPTGTQFSATVQARYVDGDSSVPYVGIWLQFADGGEDNAIAAFPSLSSDEWRTGSVAIEAAEPVEMVTLHFDLAQGGLEQTLDVDDASLVRHN